MGWIEVMWEVCWVGSKREWYLLVRMERASSSSVGVGFDKRESCPKPRTYERGRSNPKIMRGKL